MSARRINSPALSRGRPEHVTPDQLRALEWFALSVEKRRRRQKPSASLRLALFVRELIATDTDAAPATERGFALLAAHVHEQRGAA